MSNHNPAAGRWTIGRLLFDKYEVIRQLGEGYSGHVFLANHAALHVTRAIKCLSKEHSMFEVLKKEAILLKNLDHPGIPTIYDMEEDEEFLYIIEEYARGDSLKSVMLSQDNISQEKILSYGIQVCEIIEYLHSQKPFPILYLDLKPEHIILCQDKIRIIDFGSAVFYGQQGEYSFGTPGFAAPEQYGAQLPDKKTDVFVIGALLYYLASGQKLDLADPYAAQMEKMRYCSRQLKLIIGNCIQYYSHKRYRSVSVLKDQLKELYNSSKEDYGQTSLTIAIAGSQNRIGVTHFAMAFAGFLNKKGHSCLYQEKNSSGHIMEFIRHNQDVAERDGVYKVQQFRCIPDYGPAVDFQDGGFEVLLRDYGVLGEENLEAFGRANLGILLFGCREWEVSHTMSMWGRTEDLGNVIYIANFSSKRDIRRIRETVAAGKIYLMPNHPDALRAEAAADKLFQELLGQLPLHKKGGRNTVNETARGLFSLWKGDRNPGV